MKKVKEKDLTKVVGGFYLEPAATPFEEPQPDFRDFVPPPPPTPPTPPSVPGDTGNPGFRWPPNI